MSRLSDDTDKSSTTVWIMFSLVSMMVYIYQKVCPSLVRVMEYTHSETPESLWNGGSICNIGHYSQEIRLVAASHGNVTLVSVFTPLLCRGGSASRLLQSRFPKT